MTQKRRVMFIFGTRPEAIKLAPVIREIKKHGDLFDPIIVATGQHREMLDQVLKVFNIRTDYDLGLMQDNQTIKDVIIKALRGLDELLKLERPDIVIVQGDTTTTFAAALSAYYQKVPVAHVEAGLRTRDKYRPYPEEMNRKLTTSLADVHFAPTEEARQNLISEGVSGAAIYLTGNTVIDALLETAAKKYDLREAGLDLTGDARVILVTTHRRENFGSPMRAVFGAVRRIAQDLGQEVLVVIPVHKNPAVVKAASENLSDIKNVRMIEPLEYLPFVHLMKASHLILTDSGGIQEEAPSLGKPVLVLRDVTERPEGIAAGCVKIVGMDLDRIVRETKALLSDDRAYSKMAEARNPYGDGKASERIIRALMYFFGLTDRKPAGFSGSPAGEVKVA